MRRTPEWIAAQRISGWPNMSPEDYCHRCGARNASLWYADRETWLIATAAWAAKTGREGICCPGCLAEMHYEATGKRATWRFSIHTDADMLAIDRERERDQALHELAELRAAMTDTTPKPDLDPDVFWLPKEPERDYSGERGQ